LLYNYIYEVIIHTTYKTLRIKGKFEMQNDIHFLTSKNKHSSKK
jgi:hypothetical protein